MQADASEWEPASSRRDDVACTHGRAHAENVPLWIRGAYSLRLWGPEFLASKECASPSERVPNPPKLPPAPATIWPSDAMLEHPHPEMSRAYAGVQVGKMPSATARSSQNRGTGYLWQRVTQQQRAAAAATEQQHPTQLWPQPPFLRRVGTTLTLLLARGSVM